MIALFTIEVVSKCHAIAKTAIGLFSNFLQALNFMQTNLCQINDYNKYLQMTSCENQTLCILQVINNRDWGA